MSTSGILLVAHGTVDRLEELPEFLTNIRRGRPPTDELLHEVQRRYEAIGGASPLNRINREVARRLEARLGVPVRLANRLFHPYPKEGLLELAAAGVTDVGVVPLAQHSASVYGEAVQEAARDVPAIRDVACAENWGRLPALTEAYRDAVLDIVAPLSAEERSRTALLLTAHSLPLAVIEAGDPYETEVRASAEAVAAAVLQRLPGAFADHRVAFQSQGMSTGPGGRPMAWLGPDLRAALEDAKRAGRTRVVIAPIGFLADHVEILYDLDIEARGWADELGLTFARTRSLDAGDALVEALAEVAVSLVPSLTLGKAGEGRG